MDRSFRLFVDVVKLDLLRGYRYYSSLPLHILFGLSQGIQLRYASWVLADVVRADLARRLARRWLRVSIYGPPESFPHSNAWQLWALSTAVDEARARDLMRAMTCPPGQPPDTWSDADARAALHRICGWGGDSRRGSSEREDRPVSRRSGLTARRAVPSSRQLFFTFVLAAVNQDGSRGG